MKKKMLIVTLNDMSCYSRKFCNILREEYEYACDFHEDYINENILHLPKKEIIRYLKKYDLIVMYNGYRNCQLPLTKILRSLNKRIIFHESGYLPQSERFENNKMKLTLHLDFKGLYAESSLCGNLEWIEKSWINDFRDYINNSNFYKEYINCKKEEKYILCPLQLDWDASITSTTKMNAIDLIERMSRTFRYNKIIFKGHPRYTEQENDQIERCIDMFRTENKNISYISDKNISFLDLAKDAESVIGFNSTCLIDALCINKKILPLVPCPARYHLINNNLNDNEETKNRLLTAYYKTRYIYDDLNGARDILKLIFSRAKWI